MTKQLRAVFDTNVFVAATLSHSPTSPTRELLRRWLAGEFILLINDALNDEIIEKLLAHQIEPEQITTLIANLMRLAEWVKTSTPSTPKVIVADPDDDAVLACAVTGRADYLVTYDPHFDILKGLYQGVKIVRALPFLWVVRGDRPPSEN